MQSFGAARSIMSKKARWLRLQPAPAQAQSGGNRAAPRASKIREGVRCCGRVFAEGHTKMTKIVKPIEIGLSSFEDLMTRGQYFVDKSRFIPEILGAANVLLITRPRRFGKTLLLSMLESFLALDPKHPEDLSKPQGLFAGLDVLSDLEFCRANMGRWPVLRLTLKDVEGASYEDCVKHLGRAVCDAAVPYEFLLDSPTLSGRVRMKLEALLSAGIRPSAADEDVFADGLVTLEEALHAYFGRKVVLLIDEYDVPLQKARINGHYDESILLLKRFFSRGIKDSPHLSKAVLTGCLRLVKESVFTGMNNFKSFGITQTRLSGAAGFTEAETRGVLSDFGLEHRLDVVRDNYDGYRFGETHIFCPWDVMNYCDDAAKGEKFPGNYWINTSSNDLIVEFVEYADEQHLDDLRRLMAGEEIAAQVDDAMSFADLAHLHSAEQLLSLLYNTGYLTRIGTLPDGRSVLRIPNKEILACFKDRIASFFTRANAGYVEACTRLFDAFVNAEGFAAQRILRQYLLRFASIRDAGPEAFYHGLLLGMLASAVTVANGRDLVSNRESGDGYFDIALVDVPKKTGVILEIKKAKSSDDAELAKSCAAALEQIHRRSYAEEFGGGLKVMRRFGIAFCGKHCLVRMAQD